MKKITLVLALLVLFVSVSIQPVWAEESRETTRNI